jgi:hypothetical protein
MGRCRRAAGTEWHSSICFTYWLQWQLHKQLLSAAQHAARRRVVLKVGLGFRGCAQGVGLAWRCLPALHAWYLPAWYLPAWYLPAWYLPAWYLPAAVLMLGRHVWCWQAAT